MLQLVLQVVYRPLRPSVTDVLTLITMSLDSSMIVLKIRPTFSNQLQLRKTLTQQLQLIRLQKLSQLLTTDSQMVILLFTTEMKMHNHKESLAVLLMITSIMLVTLMQTPFNSMKMTLLHF